MKGTLEAERPGRLGRRPLPSCSCVSQAACHASLHGAQLPNPALHRVSRGPGEVPWLGCQGANFLGTGHGQQQPSAGGGGGAEWQPLTPASTPTEPHPCSKNLQPLVPGGVWFPTAAQAPPPP